MTRQEEFDFAAKEAEKISAKIYKLYCGTNDEEDQKYFLDSREILDETLKFLKEKKYYLSKIDEEELTEKELIKHNIRINIILKWIQDLIYENQGFLYNY